ncbi:MAG TPA: histidine--tRNA ligase [Solirubrobacteraceae bacterium]|nr:histidine--tRNA ligase [Solirubrobacteraceae bacterium]
MSGAGRIKAPRGTFDVLGEQSAVRTVLEDRARTVLEGAGYERIETPAFEATELFARGVGASTDIVSKEMYTFEDASGRSLTLRPEGTAPVCRAYVEHGMHKLRQPVRLWYLSSFFRHERAQAGRYRQFWQLGAEALGSEDPAVDAESICLLATLLDELNVAPVRLRLSSLGSLAARQEYRERLRAHLRAHEDDLSEEVRERIELNPLRAFDSEHPGTRAVMETAPRLLDFLSAEDAEHLAEVRARLDGAGVAYEIDPTLVRGLDYYTRTVFEFTSDRLGAQSGVGGGGRYDGLVQQLGGPPTPGIGWAAGIERILLAGGPPHPAPVPLDLFIAYEPPRDGDPPAHGHAPAEAFALLTAARTAGLTAQMELAGRSLKGQLGYANALEARYVAILGAGETVLKDMLGGGQETAAPDAVVHAVLRGLRSL